MVRIQVLQARSQGGGSGSYDPPPQLPIPKILFHPLAWGAIKVTIRAVIGENMPHYDLLTIVNDREWGCFSIFWRADDVTRTMSKGRVCACECLHPPPSGNPVSAPGVPPIQVQTPPHLDGWLRACTVPERSPRRTDSRGGWGGVGFGPQSLGKTLLLWLSTLM